MSDLAKWIWLSLHLKAGNRGGEILLRRYGTIDEIYEQAWENDTPGLPHAERCRLADRNLDDAFRILDFCTVNGIFLLTPDMPEYPARLRRLENFPLVLYGLGTLPPMDDNLCIAVVGTRRPSSYGVTMAGDVAYHMAAAGSVIVSGMARGIDAVAAEAALAAGGKTVAVVGTGIDLVYPPENRGLRDRIAESGAVISEFAPGTPPDKGNFPIRNRLISGLCQGSLIVEGGIRSGARSTLHHACRQGRDLFAVPGRAGEPGSFAPNEALKSGAFPVTEAYDVLHRYETLYPDRLNLSRICDPLPSAFASRLHRMRQEKAEWKTGDGQPSAGGFRDFAGQGVSESPRLRRGFARRSGGSSSTHDRPLAESIPVTPPPGESPLFGGSREAKQAAADSLGDTCSGVYTRLTEGEVRTADQLTCDGVSIQDVLTALTLLELRGVVRALPGGLYERI